MRASISGPWNRMTPGSARPTASHDCLAPVRMAQRFGGPSALQEPDGGSVLENAHERAVTGRHGLDQAAQGVGDGAFPIALPTEHERLEVVLDVRCLPIPVASRDLAAQPLHARAPEVAGTHFEFDA